MVTNKYLYVAVYLLALVVGHFLVASCLYVMRRLVRVKPLPPFTEFLIGEHSRGPPTGWTICKIVLYAQRHALERLDKLNAGFCFLVRNLPGSPIKSVA
jgi:hypothetical protein